MEGKTSFFERRVSEYSLAMRHQTHTGGSTDTATQSNQSDANDDDEFDEDF